MSARHAKVRKPIDTRPLVSDLPRRYTVETAVYYRVWDALKKEYVDSPDYVHTSSEEAAQEFADHMESTRGGAS